VAVDADTAATQATTAATQATTAATQATTAATQATTAATQATTASSNVSTVLTRLGTSSDGSVSLFDWVEANNGELEAIAGDVTSIDGTVSTINGNVTTLMTRVGTSTTGNSLFKTIEDAGFDPNLATNVETILAYIGAETDAAGAGTVFGDLQSVIDYVDTLELLMGAYTDAETAETIFGQLSKLAEIKDNAQSAKSNAAAAMSQAQAVRDELGAQGMSESTYEKIKKLESALADLRTAAETISESQVETGTVATEVLTTLTKFVNETSKALGIGGEDIKVEDITDEEAQDKETVLEKLDEINAKLNALKEAIEINDVVVKTWFEAEE